MTSTTVSSPVEQECWEANVLVAASRLLPVLVVWFLALLILDDWTVVRTDAFTLNFRLAFWLLIAETAVTVCRISYVVPDGHAYEKRLMFALTEAFEVLRRAAWRAPMSLIFRWVAVAGMTAIAVTLFGQRSIFTIAVAFVPTIVSLFLARKIVPQLVEPVPTHIRGTHIGTYQEAYDRAKRFLEVAKAERAQAAAAALLEGRTVSSGVGTIPWGGTDLVRTKSKPHFLVLGTTGSGKTLIVRMLLKSAIPRCDCRPATRALIFDPKKQFYPELVAAGIQPHDIFVLNPSDARSVAWDLAADITTKDDADNLAAILIPDTPGGKDNTFFNDALRALLSAVIESHQNTNPGRWGLIDLLNSMQTPDRLRAAMEKAPRGFVTFANYFTEAKDTVGGIISSIDARFLSKYETIARQWARAPQKISLRWWLTSRVVLLLGTNANRTGVDRLNHAIFERLAQLVCDLPDQTEDETWFFFDELRFAARLPRFSELVAFSRTKGGRVVIATQDIDGLYEVYDEHISHELLGLCDNVAALRITSPKTKEWAAKWFGEYEAWETDYNDSDSTTQGISSTTGESPSTTRSFSRSTTRGRTQRIVKRESILPSEFSNLPEPTPETGLHGFFCTPQLKAWRGPIPGEFVSERIVTPDPNLRGFIPRNPADLNPVPEEDQSEAPNSAPRQSEPGNGAARKGRLRN